MEMDTLEDWRRYRCANNSSYQSYFHEDTRWRSRRSDQSLSIIFRERIFGTYQISFSIIYCSKDYLFFLCIPMLSRTKIEWEIINAKQMLQELELTEAMYHRMIALTTLKGYSSINERSKAKCFLSHRICKRNSWSVKVRHCNNLKSTRDSIAQELNLEPSKNLI